MFSIILTVHNKEDLLEEVLLSIKNKTSSNYELNVVIDGCSDNSEKILDMFVKNNSNLKITKFITDNVFETKANNVGLKNSSGKYCVIIQDDMIINEYGWEKRLIKPIESFSDIFAVSANATHNWVYNPNSTHQFMEENLDNCWCDLIRVSNLANKDNMTREIFAIRDSVNRGPLVLKHDVLQKLNYFDEIFEPQDMDDHDLCYRAFKQEGLKVGCYLIDYTSKVEWGSTRKNGGPANWLLKANHKNSKIVFKRHKDLICGPKHDENRYLI